MYGFASRAFRLGWCGQERALRKSETIINAELSDLDKSIILKEALLAQIKEGQASYETMQQVGGSVGERVHRMPAVATIRCYFLLPEYLTSFYPRQSLPLGALEK